MSYPADRCPRARDGLRRWSHRPTGPIGFANVPLTTVILTLGALAALSGCHDRDDPPPPPPPAPTVSIGASPPEVAPGSASVIRWTSTDSTTCSAAGAWTGARATSGSESVAAPATGSDTYTLTCTGTGGTASASAAVTARPPPPYLDFTAQPSTIVIGYTTTLTWWASGVAECSATGAWDGAKAASGAETVTPAAEGAAVYRLTCTGPGGTVERFASVSVIARIDFLLTANLNDDVSVYKLDGNTGAPIEIGGSPFRAGGWPQSIALRASNRFAYVANTATPNISAYRLNEVTGALTAINPIEQPSLRALRAIAAHPSRPFVYAATSDGVILYAANPTTGALTEVGIPVEGNRSIAIHPSRDLAYATAAGATAGVFTYAIGANGGLTAIAGNPIAAGSDPDAVVVDPAGNFAYVANQSSSSISAYSIDSTTGVLTQVSGSPFATAVGPRAIAIDPQSAFLYVACDGDEANVGALLGYSIDSSTGALTQVPGSPFVTHYSLAVGIDRSGRFVYEAGAAERALESVYFRAELRSFTIGATGSLTEIPGSRLALASAALGVALTR